MPLVPNQTRRSVESIERARFAATIARPPFCCDLVRARFTSGLLLGKQSCFDGGSTLEVIVVPYINRQLLLVTCNIL